MGPLDGVGIRDRQWAGRRTAWVVAGLVLAVAVAGSLAAWRWPAITLIRAGLHEVAIPEAQQAVRLDPDNCYYKTAALAYALGRADRGAEAQAIVDELMRSGRGASARSVCLAAGNAAVGARDAMFASLENGFREHGAYMDLLVMAPWIGPYRRNPRYLRLLERMGMLESEVSRQAALGGPRFTTPVD
jgi:hypothetical protein